MSVPLITIGITCYREGDWLLQCWQSVLRQTDDRWRAVLVMDGTTHERTREIFAELEHPRLTKHAMPANMGPYPVRNKAFELTDTPYHLYLDGDDQLVPGAVGSILETFAAHPEAGFVYGDFEVFGSTPYLQRHAAHFTWDDFIRGQPTPGPCAYTKELWERLGGFADELARGNGDYDFLIGAAEAGVTGWHTGGVFYRYRIGHASKVSSSYEATYHRTHEIIVARHPRFFADSRRRDLFLAHGYKRSAQATFAGGQMEQAATFAARALRLGLWRDSRYRSLRRLLIRACASAAAARLLRMLP